VWPVNQLASETIWTTSAMQEPAMATTSRTRTAVDQPGDKAKGNTCQMRIAAASPIPVVTRSPSDLTHGGS